MKKQKTKTNGNGKLSTDENVKKVAQIEKRAEASRSISEVIAGHIADFAGSMVFVWVHVIWFSGWLLFNGIFDAAFDPFPFTFLTLVVSLEAIFLSTFILINQNRETAISERRNSLDLQINLLAEQENTKMLFILEKLAKEAGIDTADDRFSSELEDEIDPDHIMKRIERFRKPLE